MYNLEDIALGSMEFTREQINILEKNVISAISKWVSTTSTYCQLFPDIY